MIEGVNRREPLCADRIWLSKASPLPDGALNPSRYLFILESAALWGDKPLSPALRFRRVRFLGFHCG
jgi:hypothetical protein